MRVLVTGARGMLGRDMVAAVEGKGWFPGLLGREDLDITDRQRVRAALLGYQPGVVVNCAAYTNVDGAETTRDQAFAVNGLGVRNLALACQEVGADLVHLSTDYVFDGQKDGGYGVYDEPCPLNAYGASKLWGERAVLTLMQRCYVVRTSWLFGPRGKNFVTTMLRLGRDTEVLRVVNDQCGCPTYTRDLAGAIVDLIETRCYGIYHVTNQGTTTWYEFSRAIMGRAKLPAAVNPCSTAEFPRPAERPRVSVLDPFPLRETIGYLLPLWEDALERCLAEIDREVWL